MHSQRDVYIENFLQTHQQGDDEKTIAVLVEIIPELQGDEEDFAQLCYVLFGVRKSFPCTHVLERFCSMYPSSLHAVQALLAVSWAEEGRSDEATAEARFYLCKARASGVLEELSRSAIVQHGVGYAFMAVTTAYAELGWRTYALKVLEKALDDSLDLVKAHRDQLEAKRETIARDLLIGENSRIDGEWEAFWRTGEGAKDLADRCAALSFQDMALRVALLEAKIEAGTVAPFDEEFYQTVYGKTENGKTSYFLA